MKTIAFNYTVEEEYNENNEFHYIWNDHFHNYDYDDIVTDIAKDFYDNHDGWESKWPITFYVYDEKMKLLFNSEVFIEMEPNFYCHATEIAVEKDSHDQ